MSALIVEMILSFCLMVSGCFLATVFTYVMIGEINRKIEDDNRISYFWFTPVKGLRVFLEYRRLYPKGRLHIYAFATFGLGMLGLAALCVLLGGV